MSVLKKIVLAAVGAATLTREKIEEIVDELVKRGEVASGDKAKVIDEIQEKAQAATQEIRRLIDERIEALSKKLRRADDIRRLEEEIEQLRKKVEDLESKGA